MPGHNHGPQIRNGELYEKLRAEGNSKEKSARIANAEAAGTLDHPGGTLESRSKEQLYDEAKEIGIEGRSKMDKDALIDAIREH
ncbi:Rho termination factor N-terminal domain-containing protein [Sphingomonas sp. HITSZ_GF]|uniref:Rho termination factor N-terminal domain-containing protein n=1 Tax=Sphingomonas sp. HITSZ_GF TaxID=3037247 RepID=UPI00240DA300|nr:Rho termination factor N-terminal domain-containing protein [Sphingomonas sp. HITSZ_GF]MDG2532871.1 Rho termination factor N-terminal domain-containing protein [Sphingomonas sp. HITSZ_GF]